jgi:hypothetical protein
MVEDQRVFDRHSRFQYSHIGMSLLGWRAGHFHSMIVGRSQGMFGSLATKTRNRRWHLPALIVVIAAGLASRRYAWLLPAYLGKYPGDALWALMVFLLWGLALPKASSLRIGLYALGTSFADEFSQFYQAPWINGIRSTTMGHLLLGSAFAWPDLVAYTVGVALGVLAESVVRARSP